MKTRQELDNDFDNLRSQIIGRLEVKFPRLENVSVTFWFIKSERIQITISFRINEYMFIHNLKELERELQNITGTMLFKLAFKIERSKMIVWGFSRNPFL